MFFTLLLYYHHVELELVSLKFRPFPEIAMKSSLAHFGRSQNIEIIFHDNYFIIKLIQQQKIDYPFVGDRYKTLPKLEDPNF
jgi:hypothetical protein